MFLGPTTKIICKTYQAKSTSLHSFIWFLMCRTSESAASLMSGSISKYYKQIIIKNGKPAIYIYQQIVNTNIKLI